jgi:hypothetical protein
MRRSVLTAAVAGVAVSGIVGAAAATLGGLTGGTVGADDAVVAACDTDGIAVGYTTAYSATAQTYQVSAVNFTTVNAACSGKAASVTLRNGTTNLGTTDVASITVTTNAFSITLGTPVSANQVTGISLVISG